jgi:hypothetical protein
MSKQDIRKQLIKNKQTTTTKEKESEYTYVDKVRDDKKRHDEYELKNYRIITFQRISIECEYHKKTIIPVEIEISSEVDNSVKIESHLP